jgi:hypothetical protein
MSEHVSNSAFQQSFEIICAGTSQGIRSTNLDGKDQGDGLLSFLLEDENFLEIIFVCCKVVCLFLNLRIFFDPNVLVFDENEINAPEIRNFPEFQRRSEECLTENCFLTRGKHHKIRSR